MPELPEVETVRAGLAPALVGRRLIGARVREPRLRWPVPRNLAQRVQGQCVHELLRRGKYLLCRLDTGWLIFHLGMTGSLRLVPAERPALAHEHLDLLLDDGRALRYTDPRRFGALLWSDDPWHHPLIAALGMEPLSPEFDAATLHTLCRGRQVAIKTLLMNARVLVGVGNIYANEALFQAGIDPRLAAGRLSRPRCQRLVDAIKDVLTRAIAAGGSTLRDFVDVTGRPGYFQQTYKVYGRTAAPCPVCATPIRQIRQGARSTFFCPSCQRR